MVTIVFVHLNSSPPLYLRLNIRSVQRNFPDRKVVLIHNQPNQNWNLKGVTTHFYSGSKETIQIDQSLEHPKHFRKNFWFTSIARFDAIKDFLENSSEPIIHIESDVILSKDFPFEKFENLDASIAYPIVAQDRGVASTLYINNLVAAELLINSCLECVEANPSTSDMEILSYHDAKYREKVFQLAFAPAINELFQIANPHPDLRKLEESVKHFNGIFDGNDIGVYLYGTDPRNERGYSKIRSEIPNNYAALNKWNIIFDRERQFPSLKLESGILPIYSIHATCKQPLLFWQFSRGNVLRRRIKPQFKSAHRIFYPSIFCKMAIVRLIRGKNVQKHSP